MQASTLYYTGRLMTSIIGSTLTTQAIADVSQTIYSLLYGLLQNNDPVLDKNLEEMDIKAQIKVIDSLLVTLEKNMCTKPIELSLNQLHEIICHIREDLNILSKKYSRHQQKFFYYWRKFDNSKEIEQLNNHKLILDKRLDMFMKVFQIECQKNILSN